ncbi:acyltransferase domain-containing protein [Pendulispora rubella]|uniref:Acyltransferase domain-containing protein n=1 Tax=Pendulispora rubella TaxID=2741070 RepID=A0ABZ2KYJ3_9BACT
MSASVLSRDALQAWIAAWIGEQLGLSTAAVSVHARLRDLGLDSARATQLVGELSAQVGRPLALTLLWDHPTIAELSTHLTEPRSPAPYSPPTLQRGVGEGANLSVAIIAMACRFPGGAETPQAYWDLLVQGRDVVGPVPADRFDAEAFYDRDPSVRGKAVTKWGGFLERSDTFDPYLFGISPREAVEMDPQQRILLELAWDAFEGAGIAKEALRDRAVGVFVGSMWNDYARLGRGGPRAIEPFTATGQDDSIIAARISYVFGLRGPSMSLNTACSSSLVAVHLACQSLLAGESELALAGGVNLIFGPDSTLAMSKFGGMAPDGRCKAFDARANGYVRGEGAGVVLLKPLQRALADGDVVHAVIRGSAVNNDGFSNGLTSPSPAAQAEMLRLAYARAGVSPGDVHYVEAHGTGTMLGDPIEAGALGEVLGRHPDRRQPLRIGSAKTNLGHLEAAAGMAGLIKTVQALKHRRLPPSLHFETPNPNIAFDALNLAVQTALTAWSPEPDNADRPLLAGVSSFGFGGTNAHVVLESFRTDPSPVCAAKGEGTRPVFVFTGNGSQWPGMARDLMQRDAVFRAAVQRCDEALHAHGCEGVARALESGRFDVQQVDLVQPLLWAVQVGLVAMWRGWGIEPAAVVGHSVGEIAAAWAAGALDLDEAARVVVHRSRLQQRCADQGGMVLVEAHVGAAQELIDASAPGRLAVAAHNAPAQTVVSGELAGLRDFVAEATKRGVSVKTVRVNVAYHGPQMHPLRDELHRALEGIAPIAPRISMVSTVTGCPIDGPLDAAYWGRNMCDPVRFGEAIKALIRDGHRIFLEVGPHPTLAKAIEAQLHDGFVGASLEHERESRTRLLETAAHLFQHGVTPVPPSPRPRLLPLSAHTEAALEQRLSDVGRHIEAHPDVDVEALGRTLARGRSHLPHRAALVASSVTEMAELLPLRASASLEGRPRIAFVFPGQGSQWVGMGRQLLETEPVFRKAIHRWEPLLGEFTDWSLLEQLQADETTSRLHQVDVIQPAIFAIQVALAVLWRSWGVHPDVVIGHSMGEVAAAYVAGALDARDAARIICLRSRIAQKTSGRGGMAIVELSPEEVRTVLAPHTATVSLAACNGPTSCLLSGDVEALETIGEALRARDIFFRPVNVDYASHSPQMDAIKDELEQALRETRPRAPSVPFHSTVDGTLVDDARFTAAYWARNLREPVLFHQGITALEQGGFNVFLEISPHPVLTYSIAKTIAERGRAESSLILGSLKRDEDELRALLTSLGTLFAAGGTVDWSAQYPHTGTPLDLPGYPFQRERYWFDPPREQAATGTRGHALLDRFVRSTFPRERLIWEADVGLERFPYLADHGVGGVAVFPGTGYIECVLEAARELHAGAPVEIARIVFEKALFLEADAKTLQLCMEAEGAGHRFALSSYDPATDAWTRHVTGELHRSASSSEGDDAPFIATGEPVDVATFYGNLERAGNGYGPRFRAVQSLHARGDGVVGRIVLDDALSTQGARIHPVVFDACLQVMATPIALRTANAEGRESAFMPTRAERIRVFHDAGRAVQSHVRFLGRGPIADDAGDLYADIDVIDDTGRLLARVEHICFHLLEHATSAPRPSSELLYRVSWEEAPAPPRDPATKRQRWLIAGDPGGLADAVADRLLAAGHVVRIRQPDDDRAWTESVSGIVHLGNIDLSEPSTSGCRSVAQLLKTLDHLPTAPRLWLVTRGAWGASPAQTPIWGLTRAIAQEHPALWGGIVDLDPEDALELQAERLVAELLAKAPGEDRILYRDGRRHVARLLRDSTPGHTPASFRPDRAYLVTGGLGALGLRLAAWMVAHGARHLILLGRTPLPPRRTWLHEGHPADLRAKVDGILHLERLGAHVATPALDIGDAAALNAFLDGYAQEARPPIAGIAHLAGVIRPELLTALREDALEEAFQSKVHGAWNLHRAFPGDTLEFFALFSSASAVLNSPLLGSYAAANAFLDGLAAFRRTRGEPAQSFNWGFWAEAGMATRDLHFDGESQGMRSFSPATGLDLFGALLARNPAQTVIMDVDWPVWSRAYPDAAASPLLRTLRADSSAPTEAAPREPALPKLAELAPDERKKLAETLLLEELSAVLKMPASKISRTARLGSMGLDSMLSLELRNRLEKRTALTLPGTLAWNYPSVERLTGFLLEKLVTKEPEVVEVSEAAPTDIIQALMQLGVLEVDDPVLQDPVALRSLIQEAQHYLEA